MTNLIGDYQIQAFAEVWKKVRQDILEGKHSKGFPVGLRGFDDMLLGIHSGQLLVIGARVGCGKTALGLQLAYGAAERGGKVFFLSLEMTVEALVRRIFCQQTGLSYTDLICGIVPEGIQKELEKIDQVVQAGMKFSFFEAFTMQPRKLSELLNALDPKPDLLIVDFVQQISSSGHKDRVEAILEFTRSLKEYALHHRVAVIALAQLNRKAAGEDTKPNLEHLKGSGALEEFADTVVLIDSGIKKDNDEFVSCDLRVEKHRHGPVGKFQLFWHGKSIRFVTQEQMTEVLNARND